MRRQERDRDTGRRPRKRPRDSAEKNKREGRSGRHGGDDTGFGKRGVIGKGTENGLREGKWERGKKRTANRFGK